MVKTPRHIEILTKALAAEVAGDQDTFHRLREEQLRLILGSQKGRTFAEQLLRGEVATTPERDDAFEGRLAALEQRLDARRKASPGQLGLDLSSATAPSGGSGRGKPCGESHISPGYTCHKGKGTTGQVTGQVTEQVKPRPSMEVLREAMEALQAGDTAAAARLQEEHRISVAAELSSHPGKQEAAAEREVERGPGMEQQMLAWPNAGVVAPQNVMAWHSSLEARPGLAGQNARRAREFIERMNLQMVIGAGGGGSRGFGTMWKKLDPEQLDRLIEGLGRTTVSGRPIGTIIKSLKQNQSGSTRDAYEANLLSRIFRLPRDVAGGSVASSPLILLGQVAPTFDEQPGFLAQTAEPSPMAASLLTARAAGSLLGNEELSAGGTQTARDRSLAYRMAVGDEISGPEKRIITPLSLMPFRNPPTVFPKAAGGGFPSTMLVYYHEIGHQVLDAATRERERAFRQGEANPAGLTNEDFRRRTVSISRYAKTNVDEDFAETFSAFVAAPEALKIAAPGHYEWVDRILTAATAAAHPTKPWN